MSYPAMPRKIILRPPSSNRRQPLLGNQVTSKSIRFGEVVGATTAECAAVCCCCPCGIVNFLVLTMYKLPAGLCRRALRNIRHKRLLKQGTLSPRRRRCVCSCDETEIQIHPLSYDSLSEIKSQSSSEESERAVLALEKEMWDKFYGSGFWRSPSQRESSSENSYNI